MGGNLVSGWRIKFIFLLIVYFAGYATAIYTLAPAPENRVCKSQKSNGEKSILARIKSEEFAKSFNSGVRKSIDFGKEAAAKSAKYIEQKIDEQRKSSDR